MKPTEFKPGQPVTLKNGMRAGYVYLRSTANRDVIVNVLTGEEKQVFKGKLMATAEVMQLIKLAA